MELSLERTWLGNSGIDYLVALGAFVLVLVVLATLQWLILKTLARLVERTRTSFDDALVEVVKRVRPPFYVFVAIYVALRYLQVVPVAERMVQIILVVWLVYQIIRSVQIFIDVYIRQRLNTVQDRGQETVMHIVHNLVSVVLWVMGTLFVLQNLGVNVTSLIAGLGIGGLALALAAKNILSDLFSSLAIYFDKPFEPGDFVAVGEHKGTVEKVGIKTTRIKSIAGEEIIVPNQVITGATMRNFGRLTERRNLFTIGVTYETSSDKLRRIPAMIREIVKKYEEVRLERVHLAEFADSALIFKVVYHVKTRDYGKFMDINEGILFGIRQAFEETGIDMAYPTRTIYNR